MLTKFELLNMAATLSMAVVTRYLRSKLLTGPAYRLFGRGRDSAGTKPHERSGVTGAANEPASASQQGGPMDCVCRREGRSESV